MSWGDTKIKIKKKKKVVQRRYYTLSSFEKGLEFGWAKRRNKRSHVVNLLSDANRTN